MRDFYGCFEWQVFSVCGAFICGVVIHCDVLQCNTFKYHFGRLATARRECMSAYFTVLAV